MQWMGHLIGYWTLKPGFSISKKDPQVWSNLNSRKDRQNLPMSSAASYTENAILHIGVHCSPVDFKLFYKACQHHCTFH